MIGIELCQEAVEDAKVNAKLNGKTPVHDLKWVFFCLMILYKIVIEIQRILPCTCCCVEGINVIMWELVELVGICFVVT